MKRIIISIGILILIFTLYFSYLRGINNDTILFSGISVLLLLYGIFFDRLKNKKWLNAAISVFLLIFIFFIAFLAAYGRQTTVDYQEDAVIILGAGLKGGDTISLILKNRLDRALEYYQKNPGALFIVSGGQGPGETITEALAMERYLFLKGIPRSQIIQEDKSYSTHTNINYSKSLFALHFTYEPRAVIITSDFHMYRAAGFAKMAGINAARLPAPTPWYAWQVYVRECAAVLKLWLFGY